MTLISFASAKGSPGVTQTIAGLTAVWPGTVIMADIDPIGGDVALRYRDEEGGPLDLDQGLVSLGAALRGGKDATLDDHLQTTQEGMGVLVGMATPGQGQGLGTTWPHIATTLQNFDQDVLADCGRFNPGSPIFPVMERSSAVVFVTRSEIPALSHLRERLLALQEPLRIGAIDAVPVGVVIVGDPRDSRSAEDTERLFASSGLRVRTLGTVAEDPKTVRSLAAGGGRNLGRTPLFRSLIDVAAGIQALVVDQRRAQQAVR